MDFSIRSEVQATPLPRNLGPYDEPSGGSIVDLSLRGTSATGAMSGVLWREFAASWPDAMRRIAQEQSITRFPTQRQDRTTRSVETDLGNFVLQRVFGICEPPSGQAPRRSLELAALVDDLSSQRLDLTGTVVPVIPPAAATRAKRLLQLSLLRALPPEHLFPTYRGSIQFEYERASGDYLEFEVFSDRVDAYFETADGVSEFVANAPDELVAEWVLRFADVW
jgi:hypothetical protein